MLDLNVPLELDDGTPMRIIRTSDFSVNVRPIGKGGWYPTRINDGHYTSTGGFWFLRDTGVYVGGDAKRFKVLRNVDEPVVEEDWS